MKKPIYTYYWIGPDRYKVAKNGDEYIVDFRANNLCTCKGFMRWKHCKHVDFVIAQLETKGGAINYYTGLSL